jgi:hypothetical protein
VAGSLRQGGYVASVPSPAGSCGQCPPFQPKEVYNGRLHQEGDFVGHAIAQAIAEAGINVTFLVAQVINARFSAVMGFDDEAASKQATTLIKRAVKKIEK